MMYWEPPFLGTLMILVMDQRTKSIQDMAAAKEKPPTMEFMVWFWSSWETRFTVCIAADIVVIHYDRKIIIRKKVSPFQLFY